MMPVSDTTVTSTTPTTVATTVPTVSEKQRTSTSSAIPSPHETTSSQGSGEEEIKYVSNKDIHI